jgi:hypothetical protein
MRLQYSVLFGDYAAAEVLHSRRSVIRFLSHIAGYYAFPIFGICILSFAFFTAKPIRSNHTNWLDVICGTYLLSCPIVLRLTAKRRYERMRSGTGDCTIELDEDTIRTQGPHSKSEIDWKAIQFFSEDLKSFLLYLAPGKFIVIPKRVCTSEQVEELRTLLLRRVAPDNPELNVRV